MTRQHEDRLVDAVRLLEQARQLDPESAHTVEATPGIEGRAAAAKLLDPDKRPVEGGDQQQHQGLGT